MRHLFIVIIFIPQLLFGQFISWTKDYDDSQYAHFSIGSPHTGFSFGGSRFYSGVRFSFSSTNNDFFNGLNITLGGYVEKFNGINLSIIGCGSNKVNGMSLSIICNPAFPINNGIQISLVNTSQLLNGCQIGLINTANVKYGLQIGLLNKIENNPKIFRILPFINFHINPIYFRILENKKNILDLLVKKIPEFRTSIIDSLNYINSDSNWAINKLANVTNKLVLSKKYYSTNKIIAIIHRINLKDSNLEFLNIYFKNLNESTMLYIKPKLKKKLKEIIKQLPPTKY